MRKTYTSIFQINYTTINITFGDVFLQIKTFQQVPLMFQIILDYTKAYQPDFQENICRRFG